MSRYLLDTNIVSNVIKPVPSAALIAWMTDQLDDSLFISSLTLAEINFGILRLPGGRKRRNLEQWFLSPAGPQAAFATRILSFDEPAALIWARLMFEGAAIGRPRSFTDMIIAAIAEANNCVIVTNNERDFRGLNVLNPMRVHP